MKRENRPLNIIVCIKPTSETKMNPDTFVRERCGSGNYTVSAYDKTALETALALKEKSSGSSVTVISMVQENETILEILKDTIAVGADNAILLSDKILASSDTLATSYALSMVIKKIGNFDLVLCGKQSCDSNTGQVGASLAERLDIPHLTSISSLNKTADGYIECQRVIDGDVEKIQLELPALITIEKGDALRSATPRGIRVSDSFTIPVWNANTIDADKSKCGKLGSATVVIAVENDKLLQNKNFIQIDGPASKQAKEIFDRLKPHI
jgi:electron transfer flavoprotein beta subunit